MTALSTQEGQLLLVSVAVEPRRLEFLLETLARLAFPVNPEIYHDARLVYQYADGHEESESTTLVEFPSYECHLDEVSGALRAAGFNAGCLHAINMLDEIHAGRIAEPAPAGCRYVARYRVKSRSVAGAL